MSHKRNKLQRENDMSSGVLSITGPIEFLVTPSATVPGGVDVNLPGTAVYYNSIKLLALCPNYTSH